MGIPYDPKTAVERIGSVIDTLRALWSGERIPPGAEGVPPVEPMFPPVHQVPIYIAGYRTPMLELAGQKGDGYLARPLESLASFRTMVPKIRRASVEAGREDAVHIAGYLFALVDDTRREALNRAKREPFVIYMMAIQTDVALNRAGLDPELRDRIFQLWRSEDYHGAAQLMPDEMLDAFILCGTREEVAAKVWDYHEAGMQLPVLQPVVQNEEQTRILTDVAVLYGTGRGDVVGAAAVDARGPSRLERPLDGSSPRYAPPPTTIAPGLAEQQLTFGSRLRRRLGAWYEIVRPFSFTASTVPVAAAGALAAFHHQFSWPLFLGAFFAALFLHMGTNVTNEIYDVRKGIDSITSPRASHALLKGRLTEREAFALAFAAFGIATVLGIWLIAKRGWPVAALGVVGLIGGSGTRPPRSNTNSGRWGCPLSSC